MDSAISSRATSLSVCGFCGFRSGPARGGFLWRWKRRCRPEHDVVMGSGWGHVDTPVYGAIAARARRGRHDLRHGLTTCESLGWPRQQRIFQRYLGTYSDVYPYSYSKPHSYSYANTHSINYSHAPSDSQASSDAARSSDAAIIPHLQTSLQ